MLYFRRDLGRNNKVNVLARPGSFDDKGIFSHAPDQGTGLFHGFGVIHQAVSLYIISVNAENAVDTVETLNALWKLYDWADMFTTQLPLLSMSDPILALERGTTTTTSRVVQLSLKS